MNDVAFQQRELTLMFTDIVGYSRLMGRDQAQTIAMLEDYRRILLEQIDKQQGTVIEFIGDAVFARFDTPQAAISAAVGIQKELFTFNHFRDKSLPRLQTRIGLHCGTVTTKGNAVFGDDVNIAARLEPIAVADGICISQAVYEAVKDDLKEPVLSLGVQPLKNIESKVRAYLVRPLGITFKTRAHYWNRKLNQKLGAYRYPIAAAIVLVIISLIYWVPRWLVPGYDANYVEIADFQNLMNAGGEVDYLSAGITEAVRSQLADVRDVYLVKSGEGILAPIKLEGSVQKVGENLRIAYQLIRRKGNVQIAGGKLDGAYEDIFILQDRVVAEIAKYLAEEFGLPNFRPAQLRFTTDLTAYEFYLRGQDYLKRPDSQDNIDQAIKMFSTALVHDKDYVLANVGLCLSYGEKYEATKEIGFIKRGEVYCYKAYENDKYSVEVLSAIGDLYRLTGEYDKAISVLNETLELDAENYEAVLALAKTFRYANDVDEAKKMCEKALSMQPKNWLGYRECALLHYSQSDFELAIFYYERALSLTPDNVGILNGIGTAYYYKENFAKAANFFERAVLLEPNQVGYSNAGSTYYFSGEYGKALEMFKHAVRLAPTDFRLYLNMAEAYRQLGNLDKAREGYKRSIDLNLQTYTVSTKNYEQDQYLALAYLYLDDKDLAINYIKEAELLAPSNIGVKHVKLRIWMETHTENDVLDVLSELHELGYSFSHIEKDPDIRDVVFFSGYEGLKKDLQKADN